MSDVRAGVLRGEVEWEVLVGFDGRYLPATRLDPEEFPDPCPRAAWKDGAPVELKEVPDDVIEEACRVACESDPADEPDPPEEEVWERRLHE